MAKNDLNPGGNGGWWLDTEDGLCFGFASEHAKRIAEQEGLDCSEIGPYLELVKPALVKPPRGPE